MGQRTLAHPAFLIPARLCVLGNMTTWQKYFLPESRSAITTGESESLAGEAWIDEEYLSFGGVCHG